MASVPSVSIVATQESFVLRLRGLHSRIQVIVDQLLASDLWHPNIKAEVRKWLTAFEKYHDQEAIDAICFLLCEYVRAAPLRNERIAMEQKIVDCIGSDALASYELDSLAEETLFDEVVRESGRKAQEVWNRGVERFRQLQQEGEVIMGQRRAMDEELSPAVEDLRRLAFSAVESLQEGVDHGVVIAERVENEHQFLLDLRERMRRG